MDEKEAVPHMGQLTMNAIVYKKMPDGTFSPQAVWHDATAVDFLGENADDCIKELKAIFERFKNEANRLNRTS